MLDIKLITLLTVIEEKNFTKAAKKLSFTQPAITQQIHALEKEYGLKIFDRDKKGITLTKKGELLVAYARRAKAMEEHLIEDIQNYDSLITKLRIGITHTAESNNIIEIISKYSYLNRDKNIAIKIITDSTYELCKMVENYELDLAWVSGLPTNTKLLALPLEDDYLVCVLNVNHPLAKNNNISLKELKKERLILTPKSSTTRELFDTFLGSINDSIENYNVILEVDNIATIKDLIRKDFGISILSKSACMDELSKKKIAILPIKGANIKKQGFLVYNKYFQHIEIAQELIELYNKNNNN